MIYLFFPNKISTGWLFTGSCDLFSFHWSRRLGFVQKTQVNELPANMVKLTNATKGDQFHDFQCWAIDRWLLTCPANAEWRQSWRSRDTLWWTQSDSASPEFCAMPENTLIITTNDISQKTLAGFSKLEKIGANYEMRFESNSSAKHLMFATEQT